MISGGISQKRDIANIADEKDIFNLNNVFSVSEWINLLCQDVSS